MASKIFNDKSISVNGNLLKLLALQKLQDLVENNKQVRCLITHHYSSKISNNEEVWVTNAKL